MVAAGVASTATLSVHAFQPNDSPVAAKAFRHPGLHIASLERSLGRLPPTPNARPEDLAALGAGPQGGFYDWRAGRWGSLVLSRPLIPGGGVGNTLRASGPIGEAEVWQAVVRYLRGTRRSCGSTSSELAPARIGIFEKGALVQVHAPRVVDGIPVRDSGLTAVINHGNLVLLGLQSWGTLDASPRPALTPAQARAVVAGHVRPLVVTGLPGGRAAGADPAGAGRRGDGGGGWTQATISVWPGWSTRSSRARSACGKGWSTR